MDININARHLRVGDPLRAQAQYRMDRLQRLENRITAATITFEAEHSVKSAEARVAVAGGPPIIAEGEGATLRNALDSAMDRLERQLKRRRQRMRTGRTRTGRDRDREGRMIE